MNASKTALLWITTATILAVAPGALIARDPSALEQKEARVAEIERRLQSDGRLSPSERARLQGDKDRLSKEVYQQKHGAKTTTATKAGELTVRVPKSPERKQARIAEIQRRLKTDDSLTKPDRAKLQTELGQLSRELHDQKRDAQKRQ